MKTFVSKFKVHLVFALGLTLGVAGMGVAWAAQPHMTNALHDLQAAQYELQQAGTDKGGHRVNAENYTAKAIEEVKWGIQYANTQ